MRSSIIVLCAVLSGCALTTQERATMSDYELCTVAYAPMAPTERVSSALEELRARGQNCDDYADLIEARIKASTALMEYGARLQQRGYQVQQPAPRINCTSQTRGNHTYTNCY